MVRKMLLKVSTKTSRVLTLLRMLRHNLGVHSWTSTEHPRSEFLLKLNFDVCPLISRNGTKHRNAKDIN